MRLAGSSLSLSRWPCYLCFLRLRRFARRAGCENGITVPGSRRSDRGFDFRNTSFETTWLTRNQIRSLRRTQGKIHHALRYSTRAGLLSRGHSGCPNRRVHRLSRRISFHSRDLPHDVPRPLVDHAAVRGLRQRHGVQPALPLPPRQGPSGAFCGFRSTHADRHGLGSSAGARRSGQSRRGCRFAGRHGNAFRRHTA